jgi:deoxycytidylate deaminase
MCNNRHQYFIDYAKKMANKSTMQHQHGAIIVLHNEIIASGFNHRVYYMCHSFSIHAEVDVLAKVKARKNMLNLSEAEMYVVRVAKDKPDCMKNSKPCADCSNAIVKYGIRRVYYSTT